MSVSTPGDRLEANLHAILTDRRPREMRAAGAAAILLATGVVAGASLWMSGPSAPTVRTAATPLVAPRVRPAGRATTPPAPVPRAAPPLAPVVVADTFVAPRATAPARYASVAHDRRRTAPRPADSGQAGGFAPAGTDEARQLPPTQADDAPAMLAANEPAPSPSAPVSAMPAALVTASHGASLSTTRTALETDMPAALPSRASRRESLDLIRALRRQ